MAAASAEIIAAFERSKMIPVFYHEEEEVCYEVVKACYDAGLRVFEFTNRGDQARRNFAFIRDKTGNYAGSLSWDRYHQKRRRCKNFCGYGR